MGPRIGEARRARKGGRARCEALAGTLSGFIVVVVILVAAPAVSAAYRLTFGNGTSVVVHTYEEVGEAIRYPRYGGMVTVPRTDVTAIQEVPPPPPSTGPVSLLPAGGLRAPGPSAPVSRVDSARPDPSALPSVRSTSPLGSSARSTPGQSREAGHVLPAGRGPLNSLIPVVLTAAIFWFGLRKRLRGRERRFPYAKNSSLLSPAERSFYGVLARAVDGRYPIFAKVRLGDVLTILPGTPQGWTYRNQIDRKHVDFVLCAPDDLTPLLAIELDDASHERRDRRERDAFVDRALDAAGLPILRVQAQRSYAPGDLRGLIEEGMTGRTTLGVLEDVRL